MSKILNVQANDDYTLFIEFEQGHKIIFNMQKMVKTIPYSRLQEIQVFKGVAFDDKVMFWMEDDVTERPKKEFLTVDNVLFMIRD
ncbi:DUF2442 domain-containing protein [Fusibacter sp. 3D3]|uniref:DUF2442 domain-containing protein n=1 Tax=Fusibacter sp. 3D3 TaxID=1048380 RepID=UPI00085361EB|nr:DUF2442 domain-containing protein [Fusibacter sp. 3D3]GAU78558.1 hypothetical protein F3D3_3192 [Fusibacter sp. 3D3]